MGDTDRRWYDPSKVIWGLLTALSVIGMAISGAFWAAASGAEKASIENSADIKVIKSKIDEHDRSIGDCNRKLDLLLFHHGIKDDKK